MPMLNKYFPSVKEQIPFEGKDSKNQLPFKFYNKVKIVDGKTMREHHRFDVY